jgi:hypothetical protein
MLVYLKEHEVVIIAVLLAVLGVLCIRAAVELMA